MRTTFYQIKEKVVSLQARGCDIAFFFDATTYHCQRKSGEMLSPVLKAREMWCWLLGYEAALPKS